MIKKTGFRKYVVDQKNNFDVLKFYKHFNFQGREQAEGALKNVLKGLKNIAGKDRQLNKVIMSVENNDYQSLKEDVIEVYWAKRKAQYKAIEAAYRQKESASVVAIEVEEEVIEEVQTQRKRKMNNQDAKEKKKQKVIEKEDEETEEEKVEQEVAENKEEEEEEKKQKERRYVLDLHEVNSTDLASLPQHKIKKKKLTVEERLSLSSIKIVPPDPLPDYHLPDSSYSLIRRWRKALEDEANFFVPNPAPTNIEEMSIAHTLSALFLHDVKSKRFKRKNLEYKYNPSEIDYIVKYGSILLQNTFHGISDISVDWDTTSDALKESVPEIFKSIRPDLIVICAKGVEIGCGELKPFGKAKELIETDKARIGEICKRQLHIRMQKSKSMKEHATFGILLAGTKNDELKADQLEMTKLKFNNGEYEYSLLKTVKLFGRDTYYKDIEIALEALSSFKNLMNETWEREVEDINENWFEENFDKLKPTVRFFDHKEKKKTTKNNPITNK